ncbi:MAG: AGE family epimerase/isomerase [Anaerolineaceae bacterium]|nr:AGE family epimerase/isomerase [Anaerolineaceae bacterium]
MLENSWQQELHRELAGNILPFWIQHSRDVENGGFYGSLSKDHVVDNQAPRSAILTARILWTFSAAYRFESRPEYLAMAQYAYSYLSQKFIDGRHGGVYWTIDAEGQPLQDRKHSYAQAFAIYGLSEYYHACADLAALRMAQNLFELVDHFVYEPVYGGYLEGRARDWSPTADMRLSEKETDAQKSMNTLLHLLEAFTNLYKVWPDRHLRKRIIELTNIFLDDIIDPSRQHLQLLFDDGWNSLVNIVSYGHDIEASWLLLESAEVPGIAELTERVKSASVLLAQAVFDKGLWPDGSVVLEQDEYGNRNTERHWWPLAEGMVGFYNAYQITGQQHFARASQRCWQFAKERMVDRQHGDWFKVLDATYQPKPGYPKMGAWECPYHHARACLEMMRRLGK